METGVTVMETRILVIEDENEIADYLVRGLREEGFTVERAADGERLLRSQPVTGITLYQIGHFTEGTGLTLIDNGQARPLPPLGYVHAFG